MKQVISIFMGIIFVTSGLFGQAVPFKPENRMYPPQSTIDKTKQVMFQNHFTHYQRFYKKNFLGKIQYANNYEGISTSLFRSGNNRMVWGFSAQLNRIITSNQNTRELYRNLQPNSQALFLPFLLNLKFHLVDQAEIGSVVPYLIAGFGPTMGLYFPQGNNFFNTLGTISAEIGGGGFIGAGIDYLWQEEWALSFDVRYNFFRFLHPLGENQEYKGASFFIGFSRALSY